MQRFVRSTRRRGFTLMELLVVLAILVLLMAMVAPRILGLQGKASIKTAKSQLGLFESALENYAVEVGDYPRSDQGLAALLAPPAAGQSMGGMSMDAGMDTGMGMDAGMGLDTGMGMDTGMAAAPSGGGGSVSRWDGPYLNTDSIPLDPWDRPYGYAYPPTRGAGPKPDIWSCGPDGMDGTEDDIVNWTRSGSGMGGDTMGQDPLQQDPMGTDLMGGQTGPEGLPGQPPMEQGMPPLGGPDSMGGQAPMGGPAPIGTDPGPMPSGQQPPPNF